MILRAGRTPCESRRLPRGRRRAAFFRGDLVPKLFVGERGRLDLRRLEQEEVDSAFDALVFAFFSRGANEIERGGLADCGEGVDADLLQHSDTLLAARRETAHALERVVEELQPYGVGVGGVVDVEDEASNHELSGRPDEVGAGVPGMDQPVDQRVPVVIPARSQGNLSAAPGDGTEEGASCGRQEALLLPPAHERLSALHGQGAVCNALGCQRYLLEVLRMLGREQGSPVLQKSRGLPRVREERHHGHRRRTAYPAARRAVHGHVQGSALSPQVAPGFPYQAEFCADHLPDSKIMGRF